MVPPPLQKEPLKRLHQGHQGIQRCRLRAQSSVWWPGIALLITCLIKQCQECLRDAVPSKEPLIPTPLPEYPWQKLGSDLFTLRGETYFLEVDYFSRYTKVVHLKSMTSQSVIAAMKSIFSHHSLPEALLTDNGPKYNSKDFAEFAFHYGLSHCTNSPYFPQSNGHAEGAIKTVKGCLKK